MKSVLVSSVLLLLSSSPCIASHHSHVHQRSRRAGVTVKAVPKVPGYSVTWSETFSSYSPLETTRLGSANWIYDIGTSYPGGPGNWGTGEIQYYTSDLQNVFVDTVGRLNIIPRYDNGRWTSARIESKNDGFLCKAGGKMIIEAKIWLPQDGNQEGIWAAFWAMGRRFRTNGNSGWPGTGEWDIMEGINGNNKLISTVHCGTFPGGLCNEPTGISGSTYLPRNRWNNFALRVDRTEGNWENEYLAWILNGNEYHRVYGQDVGDFRTWKALVQEPYFILLNVAVGGAFPDAVAGHQTPSYRTSPGYGMMVDWIAVYNSLDK